MKNEGKETLLQQKMNELEPLAGGIVFGKEEAWEKLQGRMEQKPARKIRSHYWTAAAILLLLVCGGIYYMLSPQKNVVTIATAHIASEDRSPVTLQQSNTMPQEPETTKPAGHVSVELTKEQQVPVLRTPDTTQQYVDAPRKVKDSVVISVTAILPPAPKPMKVVSIYDLERSGDLHNTRTATDSFSLPTDLQTMPVVFIKDVERQDIGVRKIRRENRFTQVHPIFGHANDDFESAPAQAEPQPNLLKNMFHPQN